MLIGREPTKSKTSRTNLKGGNKMPYAKNPYLEDEYGGVSPDPYVQDEYGGVGGGDDSYLAGEPMITMPGGAPQSYSNWMNQPSVSPTFEYPPMPSGKNTYSVATGESEWARKIREERRDYC